MKFWELEEYYDEMLWEVYQDDFDEWTKAVFDLLHNIYPRQIQNYLRSNGVYIPAGRGIGRNLELLLKEEEPSQWPSKEVLQVH